MKASITVLFAGLVVLACAIMAAPGVVAVNPDGPEEYDIMSKLLTSEYGTDYELVLIDDATENWCIYSPLDVLFDKWPDLKHETIDSLIVRNSGAAVDLENKFNIPATYALISDQEFMQALQDTANPNWDNFDSIYTDAQGFLTFSRVGFDGAHTQALVIFSNAYRCSGTKISPSERKMAYLNKLNGSWKLIGIAKGFQAR